LGLVLEGDSAQKTNRMRLVRRAHDTKTSVIRREAVSSLADPASMNPPWSSPVPSPRRITSAKELVEAPRESSETTTETETETETAPTTYDAIEDSDVFLCETAESSPAPAIREVTLFVHGWHNVEPGLLSWTFPSLRAALDAVRRMKNAIAWCVVSGSGWTDLDSARAGGAVLVEQLA
jgi:hypothetical protein